MVNKLPTVSSHSALGTIRTRLVPRLLAGEGGDEVKMAGKNKKGRGFYNNSPEDVRKHQEAGRLGGLARARNRRQRQDESETEMDMDIDMQ